MMTAKEACLGLAALALSLGSSSARAATCASHVRILEVRQDSKDPVSIYPGSYEFYVTIVTSSDNGSRDEFQIEYRDVVDLFNEVHYPDRTSLVMMATTAQALQAPVNIFSSYGCSASDARGKRITGIEIMAQ